MKAMAIKIMAWLVAGTLTFAGAVPAAHAGGTKVIVLNVTKAGLVTKDISISDEKKMTLAKGTRVKLVFRFADKSHAVHKFILNSKGTELTSQLLTADSKETSIEFTVGSKDEPFYRLSCLVPCEAMDNLIDYVIVVATSKI
jgi:hypothetical protein